MSEAKQIQRREQESIDSEQSKRDKLFNLFRDKRVLFLLLSGVAIYGYLNGWQNAIPVWALVMLVSAGGMFVVGYLIVPSINDRLGIWKPNKDIILALNASQADEDGDVEASEMPLEIYAAHPSKVNELDFRGERRTWVIDDNKVLHVVNHINIKEGYAIASHISSVPETKKMAYREAVEEERMRNNMWARAGKKMYRKITKIARDAEHAHHARLTKKEREMQVFEAENVEEVIENEVEELKQVSDGEYLNEDLAEVEAQITDETEIKSGDSNE